MKDRMMMMMNQMEKRKRREDLRVKIIELMLQMTSVLEDMTRMEIEMGLGLGMGSDDQMGSDTARQDEKDQDEKDQEEMKYKMKENKICRYCDGTGWEDAELGPTRVLCFACGGSGIDEENEG